MNNDLSRLYTQPVPVSTTTALHYRQFKNSTSVSSTIGAIPDSTDLLKIKADLEALLPISERRIRHLQQDLQTLKKNIRIRELTEEEQEQLDQQSKSLEAEGSTASTTVEDESSDDGMLMGKMQKNKSTAAGKSKRMSNLVKQEKLDDYSDVQQNSNSNSSNSTSSKNHDRQLALEALRRKRRRDDESLLKHTLSRSESPHPNVKLKKLDDSSSITRSLSPPSNIPKHHNDHHYNASSSSSSSPHLKKKKANNNHLSATNTHVKIRAHHNSSPNPHQQQQDEVDFVRVKAKDQIPITTFWSTLDPYFRPLTEEDRQFLMPKDEKEVERYYMIPALGKHYTEVWSEEDQQQQHNIPDNTLNHNYKRSQSPALNNDLILDSHQQQQMPNLQFIQPPMHQLTDDQLLKSDLSCGLLTERLLSSLVVEQHSQQDDDDYDGEEDEEDDDNEDEHASSSSSAFPMSQNAMEVDMLMMMNTNDDVINTLYNNPIFYPNGHGSAASVTKSINIEEFEERLKRELRYAGLFGEEDDIIDWNAREDDEVCAELRAAARELKEQFKKNEERKKKLLQAVDHQLQYEQYRHVLDTLDAQVEQCYLKRFRTQKSKKRKTPHSSKTALSEHAVHAMSKRKAWIDALECIFKDKNMTMPARSIYEEEGEEEEDAMDEDDDNEDDGAAAMEEESHHSYNSNHRTVTAKGGKRNHHSMDFYTNHRSTPIKKEA